MPSASALPIDSEPFEVVKQDGESISLRKAMQVTNYAGTVLDLRVESETYPIRAAGLQPDFARNDEVPFIDVTATLDARTRQAAVLMLNRDITSEREVVLDWNDIMPSRVLAKVDGTPSRFSSHARGSTRCSDTGQG